MKLNSTCLGNYLIAISIFLILSIPGTAQLQPIPLNGFTFNEDLIAEGAGNDPSLLSTASFFNYAGKDYIFYDETFRTSHSPTITGGGLPASGLITNSSDNWQLAVYTSRNALFFAPQLIPSTGSIILATPAKFSQISLLATSVNGPVIVDITITFSDLSTVNYGTATVKDWVGGVPSVIQGFGAIERISTVTTEGGPPTQPRLYQIDLALSALDQLKDVSSIEITNTDDSNLATAAFFAASGISAAILPITFSSLKGEYKSSENKIDLSWQAEASLMSPGFEVERSVDGQRFSSIAIVPPQKNLGNSIYSYSDIDLQNRQTWFYRIKESLAGGVIYYSRIINVKTSAVASFKIIQSGGYIRLVATSPEKSYMYKILDLRGRELKSGTISSANQYSVDIRNLPAGPYVINFLDQTQTRALRFVK